MKVLVCGSRGWRRYTPILNALMELPKGTLVIHGGASGADAYAARACRELGLKQQVFYADWGKLGKRAGILRNVEMLDEEPDRVLAFWDGESRGTKHAIDEAFKRGIDVKVHS